MLTLEGKSVFAGIAIGNIKCIDKSNHKVKRYKIENIDKEIDRVTKACGKAKKQLEKLYKEAVHTVGEANADIFNIHQMMIDDSDYRDSIENIIKTENVNAEYALAVTGDNFANMFASMDDEYMKERANDVRDITDRIITVLTDDTNFLISEDKAIIFGEDLLPSQTVQFDKSKVLAFVTMKGSVNSHTAILARTMNIPAVVGTGNVNAKLDGKYAVVDGFSGKVYIEPDEETLNRMLKLKKEDEENKKLLQKLKGKESITVDGREINIFANIGSLADVGEVLANDADGIGLFRSEFLYLEKETYPTEEEQFSVYKTVAQNMAGKKVIIRTLDIGADKQAAYFDLEKEENPALGFRAVRLCLERQDIFKTQLRAILRASAFGNISVMIPMIVSYDEVLKVKGILEDAKRELAEDTVSFNKDIEFGIMIETPAAAIMSDVLAKEVDFFSIGTNDLIQYTLASDRQNPKLDYLYDEGMRAVLRIIKTVCTNAEKEGIWVGICGELASDRNLTEFFLKAGVDELSVSPPNVLALRKKIRETNIQELNEKIISEI
ncbi:MAG: phosphoenolpyruvate--protein phosphotransferase [Clostridia bacterium]|nr:phosphoenolpyruvate--protein phosphotransferase [Clostridia bacterium]